MHYRGVLLFLDLKVIDRPGHARKMAARVLNSANFRWSSRSGRRRHRSAATTPDRPARGDAVPVLAAGDAAGSK
jgi:hypothetical protein